MNINKTKCPLVRSHKGEFQRWKPWIISNENVLCLLPQVPKFCLQSAKMATVLGSVVPSIMYIENIAFAAWEIGLLSGEAGRTNVQPFGLSLLSLDGWSNLAALEKTQLDPLQPIPKAFFEVSFRANDLLSARNARLQQEIHFWTKTCSLNFQNRDQGPFLIECNFWPSDSRSTICPLGQQEIKTVWAARFKINEGGGGEKRPSETNAPLEALAFADPCELTMDVVIKREAAASAVARLGKALLTWFLTQEIKTESKAAQEATWPFSKAEKRKFDVKSRAIINAKATISREVLLKAELLED